MALKKTITLDNGLVVADAYHRIEYAVVSKGALSFRLSSYVSPEYPACCDMDVSCPYELDGKNPFAQGYDYLKTLPRFAGVIDC